MCHRVGNHQWLLTFPLCTLFKQPRTTEKRTPGGPPATESAKSSDFMLILVPQLGGLSVHPWLKTCGSWGALAQKFFNRLARKIAMRSGSSLKDLSAEMWSTLSVGLAQSVANMLLASAPHMTAMIACAQSSFSSASNQPLAVTARGSASPRVPPATTLSARTSSTSGEVDCLRPPSLLLVAQTASAGLGPCVTTPLPLGPTVPPLASVPGMHSVSPADPRGHPAPDLFSHDPYSSSLKPTAPVPQACGASKNDFSVRIREAEQHWPRHARVFRGQLRPEMVGTRCYWNKALMDLDMDR